MADTKRRPGQPTALNRTLGHRDTPDGPVPITVFDRAAEVLRTGGTLEDAASRCGVRRTTLYNWQRDGARAAAAIEAGTITDADLTDYQRDALEFLNVTEQARTEGKLLLLGLTERLARGGIPQETITEKVERIPQLDAQGSPVLDADGRPVVHEVVVERSTKRSVTLPDGTMLRWRLAKGWPDEFSDRIEVSGPGGGPVQLSTAERASSLADDLERMLQAQAEADAAERRAARAARAKR